MGCGQSFHWNGGFSVSLTFDNPHLKNYRRRKVYVILHFQFLVLDLSLTDPSLRPRRRTIEPPEPVQ